MQKWVCSVLLAGALAGAAVAESVTVGVGEPAPAAADSKASPAVSFVVRGAPTSGGEAGETRTWLGVAPDEISDDVRSLLPDGVVGGLIVRHVDADSPADKAGIQLNDILLKLDDQILMNPLQLRQLVMSHKKGDKVALTALRKGKEVKFTASLATTSNACETSNIQIIGFLNSGGDVRMELPPEMRKMMESAEGGTTVFSTSIVIRAQGGGPDAAQQLKK